MLIHTIYHQDGKRYTENEYGTRISMIKHLIEMYSSLNQYDKIKIFKLK